MICPNAKCNSEDSIVLETRVHYAGKDYIPVRLRKRLCKNEKCKETFLTVEITLLHYDKYEITKAIESTLSAYLKEARN